MNDQKITGIYRVKNESRFIEQSLKSVMDICSEIIILDDIDNINEQSQQIFRNFIDNYQHNVFFISSCKNS